MKITNHEKQRISKLYNQKVDLNEIQLSEFYSRTMKLLNEQQPTYSWSTGGYQAPKGTTTQVQSSDPSGARWTRPSVPTDGEMELYIKNIEKGRQNIHDFLFYTSIVLGLIPHPITQIASVAADYLNAANYATEGNYYESGLYATLASTSLIMTPVISKIGNLLKNTRNSKKLVDVGIKLSKGKEGLKTLTKSEMQVLNAMADSKNLQAIYKEFNEVSKKMAESYLIKPNVFRQGYTSERFAKMGRRLTNEFYEDMSKRGINSLIDMTTFTLLGGGAFMADTKTEDILYPKYIAPMLNVSNSKKEDKEIDKSTSNVVSIEKDKEVTTDKPTIVTIKVNKSGIDKNVRIGNIESLNKQGYYGNNNQPIQLYIALKDFDLTPTQKIKKGEIIGGY